MSVRKRKPGRMSSIRIREMMIRDDDDDDEHDGGVISWSVMAGIIAVNCLSINIYDTQRANQGEAFQGSEIKRRVYGGGFYGRCLIWFTTFCPACADPPRNRKSPNDRAEATADDPWDAEKSDATWRQ
ncbi:hypothetical protein HN011_005486 [Eciton burchellii]|nr:hypothetical protein HN011_005486 [Eciton burchellii]